MLCKLSGFVYSRFSGKLISLTSFNWKLMGKNLHFLTIVNAVSSAEDNTIYCIEASTAMFIEMYWYCINVSASFLCLRLVDTFYCYPHRFLYQGLHMMACFFMWFLCHVRIKLLLNIDLAANVLIKCWILDFKQIKDGDHAVHNLAQNS